MSRAKARRRFNLARSKLPYIFLALLLAYFAISVTTELGKLWYMQRNIADMEQSVRELRKKNEALWDKVKLLQSDAHVEKVAREKLGLVKPGETRVVPVPAAPEQAAPAPDPTIRD
ncbi:MAG: FtsB family cell division protein [Desulfotomaculales bacterium]